MRGKIRLLKNKWNTFHDLVVKYNETYDPNDSIVCPNLERVHKMDIEDSFWNIGNLTHPDEDWAVNPATQTGIQAYLKVRSCTEELRRIGLEVLHVIDWSLRMAVKLESLKITRDVGMYYSCSSWAQIGSFLTFYTTFHSVAQ